MNKKIVLCMKMIKEEPFITTSYIILLFIVAFLLNESLAYIEGAKYSQELLEPCKNSITVLPYLLEEQGNKLTAEESNAKNLQKRKNLLNQLGQDKKVKEVEAAYSTTASVQSTYEEINLYQYNQAFYQNMNLKLSRGRWFQNEKELVMNHSAMKKYKIGDQVTLQFANGKEQTFTITGFLVNDFIVSNSAVASMEDTVSGYYYEELIYDTRQYALSYDIYTGIVSPDFDSDNLSILPTFYVTVPEKTNIQNVIKYLKKKYGKEAEFYHFNSALQQYKKENLRIWNREEVYLIGGMLILFCTGFCINNVLRIQKKSKEFAIYYICGLTWGQSVLLSCFKNILIFITAVPLGTIMFYFNVRNGKYFDVILTRKNMLLVFCGLILIYFLFSLPVYFRYKKMDPIMLQRRGYL